MEAIVSKIVALMKDIGAIPKNSVNAFHKYKYRSHEDVMNALQPALVKAGLLLVPVEKSVTLVSPGHVLIEVRYQLTDGKENLSFVGIGEGQDVSKEGKAGDKAAYKAQTGALKYALNDILALGTQDDPEADQQTHAERPIPKAQAKPSGNADLQAAADQIADWAAKLEESSSMDELKANWDKVPQVYRTALANKKNEIKIKLSGGK